MFLAERMVVFLSVDERRRAILTLWLLEKVIIFAVMLLSLKKGELTLDGRWDFGEDIQYRLQNIAKRISWCCQQNGAVPLVRKD